MLQLAMASRTQDLDSVAPDDLDVVKNQPKPVNTSASEDKPKLKTKKKAKSVPTKKTSASKDLPYRQKVYELVGKASHPLTSFLARPNVFSFDQRDSKEEIILVLRSHWFTNLKWIVISLLMLLFPLFCSYFNVLSFLPGNYKIIAAIFWFLVTFVYAFEKFLTWYFNVFIITDERVVDIDFYNLLVKEVTEAKISMIQDVTYNVIGFIPTVLNYGNLFIQTASEVPMIEILNVPNPETVSKILQQMRLEEEQEALDGRVS